MSKGFLHHPPSAIRYPLVLGLVAALAACSPKGDALYARAEKALAEGDVSAAIIDLKNYVEADPQDAKGRALLGAALVQSGDMQAGEIELRKATDLGAPPQMLLVPECKLLAAKGEYDAVLARCAPDSAPATERADLLIARGQAYSGLKRLDDARVAFEAAAAERPGSLEAWVGLAAVTHASSGVDAAKAVLEKAPATVKDDARYWLTLGGIEASGGSLVAAEAAFATALEKTAAGNRGSNRLESFAALVETQLRQGRIDAALATSQRMIEAAPQNPFAKLLRGQALAAGGQFDQARTLVEEVVSEQPQNSQARLLLGLVNLKQGNAGQAEMNFANVVATDPGNVRAQRLLAETRARLQTPEQSLAALKPALEQASADPTLLAMASRLSLAKGDRAGALEYLAQATSHDVAAAGADVQLEIAGGYLAAGEFGRAIELLEAMPQGGLTGYQREYLLMLALLRNGEKDRAVAESKQLLARAGDDPTVRNLVASVFAAAGERDAGRAQFNEALKLKPNDPETLLNLARLDLAEGKTADAERHFQAVLQQDPKNLVATLGAAVAAGTGGDAAGAEKWLQKANADHPQSNEVKLAMAQFYVGRRDFAKARAIVDEAAKAMPGDASISNMRGMVLMGDGDMPGAIASFKEAVKQAPKATAFTMNLARAHLVDKDLGSALEVLHGLMKSEPKYTPALALAAAACLRAGEVEKAAGYVERLRQAEPDAPGTLRFEGDLAMAQKRHRDAWQAYRKVNDKAPSRESVIAEYRAGTLSGAAAPEQSMERWIVDHPGDAIVISVLAEARQRAGNVAAAIGLYEDGVAKAPGNAVLLNNLAVLYQDERDPKALETAAKAHNLAPDAPAIKDTYGWILLEQGSADQALPLLRDAAKALPDNAEIQYHYAAALAKSGDEAAALPILRKAVGGQLPAAVKGDAQKLLRELSR